MIIVSPADESGNRTVWVFHFEAGDDPYGTIAASGPFPPGSHAVIFGGDDTDPISMGTLRSVQQYFSGPGSRNITIDGVINSPGMWVDNDGNYYIYETERRTATKDETRFTSP